MMSMTTTANYGLPDRGRLAAKLPRSWTDEGAFLESLRQHGKIRDNDNATLKSALASLRYYGLIQYRRENGARQLRAVDPAVREAQMFEAKEAWRRIRWVEVADEFGDLHRFAEGPKADAERRRVRAVLARKAMAAHKQLEHDAALPI